ncbi:hypothetical protein OS128_09580 [Corynebacterium sp. P5848]|uniref:hypothetical protein n=1 Tax=Corynebacterium marambiense TaxID=2765364 RepID=UPI002260D499|nr:hypothetical protein [Corynebacterium marambiense]MCX7543166.1 hypothetical protein [Corynebacterium marambiense]
MWKKFKKFMGRYWGLPIQYYFLILYALVLSGSICWVLPDRADFPAEIFPDMETRTVVQICFVFKWVVLASTAVVGIYSLFCPARYREAGVREKTDKALAAGVLLFFSVLVLGKIFQAEPRPADPVLGVVATLPVFVAFPLIELVIGLMIFNSGAPGPGGVKKTPGTPPLFREYAHWISVPDRSAADTLTP